MPNRFGNPAAILGAALALAAAQSLDAQPLQDNTFGAEARAALGSSEQSKSSAERTFVRPKAAPTSIYFPPDSGWQTCDRAAELGAGPIERASTVAYQKFYWSQLERAPGEYNFLRIEAAAAKADMRGQILDLRPVMPYAPEESAPKFFREGRFAGADLVYDDGESRQQFWGVDLNDAGVRSAYISLINALGVRYDSDPRIGMIDISIFGLWGEGHIGEVSFAAHGTGKAAQQKLEAHYALSAEARKELIDAYFDAFPTKIKLAQITDVEGLKYAVSRGAGIRLDCFGGYHMERNVYLQNLQAANAMEVWKTAPIVGEICGTLQSWAENWGSAERQYNERALQEILDRGTDVYHLTTLNAKNGDNGQIPAKLAAPFEKFLAKLGYRLTISEASFESVISEGQALTLHVEGANTGTAPAYNKNLVWAVQLQDARGKALSTFVSERTIAGVLPGNFKFEEQIPVKDLPAGTTTVAIAVVDKTQTKGSVRPVVHLPIENERSGWYPLGAFQKN